jgi:hypothetical protein
MLEEGRWGAAGFFLASAPRSATIDVAGGASYHRAMVWNI